MSSSRLLEYSSRNSTLSSQYGNGHFKCVINNANKVDGGRRVHIHRVIMPNMFPNVKEGHTFSFVNGLGQTICSFTVPEGQYTAGGYATTWTAICNGALATASVPAVAVLTDLSSAYLQLTVDANAYWSSNSVFLQAPKWVFDVWGYNPVATPSLVASSTYNLIPLASGATYNQTTSGIDPINFTGEQLVYIAVKEMCQGNMVSSDGQQYNILAVCPLTTTPYGTYKELEIQDANIDTVQFSDQLDLRSAEISVLDASFQPIYIPTNHHVTVVLKAYY